MHETYTHIHETCRRHVYVHSDSPAHAARLGRGSVCRGAASSLHGALAGPRCPGTPLAFMAVAINLVTEAPRAEAGLGRAARKAKGPEGRCEGSRE